MEASINTKAEDVSNYNASYYQANKAKILARKKLYHIENKAMLGKKSSDYNKSEAGRKSFKKYRVANAAKVYAHNEVNKALQRGDLVRMPCECCGSEKSEAHHDDYLKPLDVRFLCKYHHIEWHSNHGEGLNGGQL